MAHRGQKLNREFSDENRTLQMMVAELSFFVGDDSLAEAVEDGIIYLLGALRRNGQILGWELPLAKTPNGYLAPGMLPASDSLNQRHWNLYVTQRMEELCKLGAGVPSVNIIGPESTGCEPCQCKARMALLLFTTYICLESPLRCLTCFLPVPLYEIPPTQSEEYGDIISWESNYKACDTLQMNCAVGERFGTRQLSALNSPLTIQGRDICAKITASIKLPVYYYLYRDTGRSDQAERARLCPSCGGSWLRSESLHGKFDFQCDQCQLLSNIAWSLRK